MRRLLHKIASILLLIFFVSCKSDKPTLADSQTVNTNGNRVWVLNEGNFQFGNAALGIYDKTKEVYFSKVFQSANNENLGDVLQSINIIDGNAFLTLNNSGKIEVIDTSTFQRINTITGLTSPRYITKISDSKAYVSDLYANGIHILNLNTFTIEGRIPSSEWTERMLLMNDTLFVSMPKSESIYVVDSKNDIVLDSIPVNYGSNGIVLDKNGYIWVLCQGSQSKAKKAGIFKINPHDFSIVLQIDLDEQLAPANLQISSDGDFIFFIYNDVYRMSVEDVQIPMSVFYPSNNRIYYGLGIDPSNGDVYIADAKDYVQKGEVIRLDNQGGLIHSFQTDIIPSGFSFD